MRGVKTRRNSPNEDLERKEEKPNKYPCSNIGCERNAFFKMWKDVRLSLLCFPELSFSPLVKMPFSANSLLSGLACFSKFPSERT
jgi:hypothetical protein